MSNKELIEEVKKLGIQLHELRKENASLKDEIKQLQLDKQFWYKQAKEKVVKGGE